MKFNRAIILLSLGRVTERELEELYYELNDVGPVRFAKLLKNVERDLKDIPWYALVNSAELNDFEDISIEQVYQKINEFKNNEAKVSVPTVVEMIRNVLMESYPNRNLIKFDSRQGLRQWIRAALKDVSPSEIVQAVAILREHEGREFNRSWSIGRK